MAEVVRPRVRACNLWTPAQAKTPAYLADTSHLLIMAALFLAQGWLHFPEHVAQFIQRFYLKAPANGILGQLNVEWVHIMYNWGLLLLMILGAVLTPSVALLVVLVGAVGWMETARVARVELRSLRAREFVIAARAAGARFPRLLTQHLLLNAAGPLVVAGTLAIARISATSSGTSSGRKPVVPSPHARMRRLGRPCRIVSAMSASGAMARKSGFATDGNAASPGARCPWPSRP